MATDLADLERICALLADPVDHLPLAVAPASVLTLLQDQHARRVLRTTEGTLVGEAFDAALLRQSGDVAYLVRDGVADLLVGAGVRVIA